MLDPLGNAVHNLFPSGTNRMDTSTSLPGTHRTGDFSINIIGNHTIANAVGCIYGEVTDHLRIYIDRRTDKLGVIFQNQSGGWREDVLIPSQMDDSDMRSFTVTCIDDTAQVYLNGSPIGSTVDLTGRRNWLGWQGNKFSIGATKSSANKVTGNHLALRYSNVGWLAEDVMQLHNADKVTFSLP
jgi:hypothetical protein